MTDRILLLDCTPPMRNARRTEIAIDFDVPIRVIRDEKIGADAKHDAHDVSKDVWDALVKAFLAFVPLGEARDLIGKKRGNKGVAFNHAKLHLGDKLTSIDYLSSDVDEDEGNPALRALVDAIRAA